ncbi:MAG TPA: hypothetical protein PLL44_03440 [Novosphingobium sp.]|jgi:hypothetical protein|nr:hypothetical protein [Novosphingobium sp.]HOA48373.1 hypothetical protein [Novosphingobium sp.]HPB22133.1 hypothetical protein [Novosphingobium sp.]HPZ47002.1 hypothetical protein [Novosphingobium sp.]HQD99743.1 hypothetical protein [Novosphingobium sp.]
MTRDRLHSIGWAAVLLVCLAVTLALTFRVNAVKSQVRLTERKIVAVRQDKLLLETEFETRANQQQLRSLNDVEFGYQAPTAEQYLAGERQLAMLGKPRAPDAPSPIRVASADDLGDDVSGFPAMVSPLTGKAMAAEAPRGEARKPVTAATLARRLGEVEQLEDRRP